MGPCGQKRYSRAEVLAGQLKDSLRTVSISDEWTARMLEQIEKDRAAAFRKSSIPIADKKDQLAAVQAKLGRLLNAMLEGVVSRDEYTAAKEPLIAEKSALEADLVATKTQGGVWLEPLAEFVKQANQAEKAIFSARLEDVRDFHRKIGSNLLLRDTTTEADARSASALGAPPSENQKRSAELRRGGCAARASARTSRPSFAWVGKSSENQPKSGFLAFPAASSSRASRGRPATPAASPSASASRQKPSPVLLVQFPEPWSLWSAISKSSGWWRVGESNSRPSECHSDALPTELTPQGKEPGT